MEFRILGSLEVLEGGRALDVGGAKQRALLAVLLLNANQVVSNNRLIDALWEELPPETAQKALQVYVSQLRKALGRERLGTKPSGYLLRVEEGELDLERFQRLWEEGEFDEALSLWRGAPLVDFSYQRFAQVEIARLEELRLGCLEERIERDLARGSHAELVGQLDALVKEHPLREQLRCQLMLSLYRSGRQAEALEAYQEARRALVEELGIEPGRALRELHQAILNQDPALDLAVGERPEREEPIPAARPPPGPEPAAREARKTVTAVFVEMAIWSARSEALDPEALRRVTSRAFGDVEAAVDRHGGTVETVAGDAITAVFGLPTVHEDDALRGVRAAAEARDALSGLATELRAERALKLDFRIGISTGEVVTGGEAGLQLRATGAPLTLSSRLGQAAEPGEIALDQATHRLVRDAVVAESAGDAWRLLRVAATVPGRAPRLVSPMVGRERERRRLHDSFDQVVGDRSCQLFTVLGLAGVGKSRLVQEFLSDIVGQALVARGRCLPYGEGITFWPLLEAVKEAVGLKDTDSPDEGREKLARVLEGEAGVEMIAQRAAEMIGLAEAGGGGAEEGFTSVRALFEALAAEQPLVLVFDDIHWGEATFLDLVEHLADWIREAPILLVCLARPELLETRPGWGGGKLNVTSILLEPLSDEDCGRLIENLVGRADLAENVEKRIAQAAEGNPLFVEEMLSMLIDDGLLVRENGRWAVTGDIAAVPVPPTIQALLAARLDRLNADERALIERAAVEGKVFHEGSVAELAPHSIRQSVATHLGTLVRKELIRPDKADFAAEHAFRFRHLLIRDAAYESIPKEARAEMHERFAAWLERAAGERAAEYEEVVGYHLEQAYRYWVELGPVDEAAQQLGRKAAERLGAAGRRAFARSDAPAAVNLISRAVALLPPDDPARVELVPNVRVVQGMSGDLSWAHVVLGEAIAADDERLKAHALVQRAFLRLFTEPEVTPSGLIEVAEQAIDVFEEVSDELGLARAWRLIAQAHYLGRQAGLSAEAAGQALVHARRAGDQLEEREIVEWLTIALILGPAPAPEAIRRCVPLLGEIAGSPDLEVIVSSSLAPLAAMQGRMGEAEEFLARARRVMDERGKLAHVAVSLFPFNFALTRMLAGEPIAAERELWRDYEELERMHKSHFSSQAALLAQLAYGQGRLEEAEHLSLESEHVSGPNDVYSHILWRATQAKVLARRGHLEAAESLAREAVAFAADSDFLNAHGDALMDLAEVLGLSDRSEEAAAALEQAVVLYEQKGNVVSAARARARLKELA